MRVGVCGWVSRCVAEPTMKSLNYHCQYPRLRRSTSTSARRLRRFASPDSTFYILHYFTFLQFRNGDAFYMTAVTL